MNNVDVAIDLGSSALKIAFSYTDEKGKIHFGKISDNSDVSEIGIPAIAFYDGKAEKWVFGSQISGALERDFSTVVGVKSLIALLSSKVDAPHYAGDRKFPKFYLPNERETFGSFDAILRSERYFENENTPKDVCEKFFAYVAALVKKELKQFEKNENIGFNNVRVSLVYPSHIGNIYIKEITRLTEKAFGTRVFKSLSAVKALGMLASTRNLVADNEKFLVFDIGEENITVAKTWIVDGQPFLDGVDGHNEAEAIGGLNIDEAICEYVEDEIQDRETIFTESAGEAGHVYERCTDSQKYRFLKEIKKAKHILSSELGEHEFFQEGAKLYIMRECVACKQITIAEIEDVLGVNDTTGSSVARRLVEYISSEAMRAKNDDVKKIFLAGGVSETVGLVEYVQRKLDEAVDEREEKRERFKVLTFGGDYHENWNNPQNMVGSDEDSSYAPALGGAIVATKEIDIKTILTKSYGTVTQELLTNSDGRSSRNLVLSIIANKGSELKLDEPTRFVENYRYEIDCTEDIESIGDEDDKDEIISTNLSKQDIEAGKYSKSKKPINYGKKGSKKMPIVGDPKSDVRTNFYDKTEGKSEIRSTIWFFHNGERVKIRLFERGNRQLIAFSQGIEVDTNGAAKVIIEVCQRETNGCFNDYDVKATYWDKKTNRWSARTARVPIKKIKMEYSERAVLVTDSNVD